jgi:hypothetical protein
MSAIPSSVDAVSLLEELGLVVADERGDEVYALCPGHKARVGRFDNEASWSVNVETGEHYCFSCGYSGTIWWLIATKYGWTDKSGKPDLDRAKRWMEQRAGTSLDVVSRLKSTAKGYVRKAKRKAMDESRLALFTAPPEEVLEERGIDTATAKLLTIYWAEDHGAFVLPIRDPDKFKLWGWQLKGHGLDNRVFRNHPIGVKKSETLFGVEHMTDGECYLVESPLDAARLYALGYENAVASYGATWSDEQLSIICERADSLVVALDNDPAGIRAALKLMGMDVRGKRIKGAKDWSERIDMKFFQYYTDDKDVGDMDWGFIEQGMATARSSVRGVKAVLG